MRSSPYVPDSTSTDPNHSHLAAALASGSTRCIASIDHLSDAIPEGVFLDQQIPRCTEESQGLGLQASNGQGKRCDQVHAKRPICRECWRG